MVSVVRMSVRLMDVPERSNVPNRVASKPIGTKGAARRLHAHAVKRIYDRHSGELIGWLYEWNTGEIVPRWKEQAQADVTYD